MVPVRRATPNGTEHIRYDSVSAHLHGRSRLNFRPEVFRTHETCNNNLPSGAPHNQQQHGATHARDHNYTAAITIDACKRHAAAATAPQPPPMRQQQPQTKI